MARGFFRKAKAVAVGAGVTLLTAVGFNGVTDLGAQSTSTNATDDKGRAQQDVRTFVETAKTYATKSEQEFNTYFTKFSTESPAAAEMVRICYKQNQAPGREGVGKSMREYFAVTLPKSQYAQVLIDKMINEVHYNLSSYPYPANSNNNTVTVGVNNGTGAGGNVGSTGTMEGKAAFKQFLRDLEDEDIQTKAAIAKFKAANSEAEGALYDYYKENAGFSAAERKAHPEYYHNFCMQVADSKTIIGEINKRIDEGKQQGVAVERAPTKQELARRDSINYETLKTYEYRMAFIKLSEDPNFQRKLQDKAFGQQLLAEFQRGVRDVFQAGKTYGLQELAKRGDRVTPAAGAAVRQVDQISINVFARKEYDKAATEGEEEQLRMLEGIRNGQLTNNQLEQEYRDVKADRDAFLKTSGLGNNATVMSKAAVAGTALASKTRQEILEAKRNPAKAGTPKTGSVDHPEQNAKEYGRAFRKALSEISSESLGAYNPDYEDRRAKEEKIAHNKASNKKMKAQENFAAMVGNKTGRNGFGIS